LPDGRPWVLTFFYAGCKDVCPTLLYNVMDVADALPAEVRAKVAFGGISFDPARDTVARLAEHADDIEFRNPNAYLLTGEPRVLDAALKAFKFDFKPDRNGGFQHTSLMVVMDGQGRIRHHFYGLHPDIPRIAAIARDLAGGG
jgi:protein SCO1/2